MKPDQPDAATKEAARVEAAKRIAIAKFAAETGAKNAADYELATLLGDAIYKVFPLPPVSAEASTGRPEPTAKPSKAKEGKPDGD